MLEKILSKLYEIPEEVSKEILERFKGPYTEIRIPLYKNFNKRLFKREGNELIVKEYVLWTIERLKRCENNASPWKIEYRKNISRDFP